MALELNGTTGVSLVQDGVITDANLPAGSVLQVVYGSYTDLTSTSSTTPVETGVTADITPSSTSSKILIIANLVGIYTPDSANYYLISSLHKNGSLLTGMDAVGGWTGDTGRGSGTAGMTYLDSPSSTATLTYSIRAASSSGSYSVTWNNYSGSYISRSSITLMEIAA